VIFVTIGLTLPFDRLVGAVDAYRGDDEVIVQCGDFGTRPARATCVDYLPFDSLVEHVRRASTVICHAGVGSVLVSMAEHKRPVLVPRRAALGEAADDHQLAFARRLAERGLATVVENTAELWSVGSTCGQVAKAPAGALRLSAELRDYLGAIVAAGG
jgi:UDP-N-acetylglucosamine transferase subunit ALG13